jgi:hypothetical protein
VQEVVPEVPVVDISEEVNKKNTKQVSNNTTYISNKIIIIIIIIINKAFQAFKT